MQQTKYQVYAFCNRCGGLHNMYIGVIKLYDGPPNKKSIVDVFDGKVLPPHIAVLTSTKFICPKTKRFTLQKDNNQIFLVPFLETSREFIDSRDQDVLKRNSLFRDFSHVYSSDDLPDAVKVK